MKTQILLRYKPVRAVALPPIDPVFDASDGLSDPISSENNWAYRSEDNPNWRNDLGALKNVGIGNEFVTLDLYEGVSLPLNYTISDVREPEKRKTNFSKTITVPGTKKNNRLFNHIYEISGNSKFNPNLRTEVIILEEGIQIMRGNMQLINIKRFDGDDVEYDVLISGDFTSLFADIGISKLSDLDFSEYKHTWDRSSIENSWDNLVRKVGGNLSFPNFPYQLERTVDQGPARNFNSIGRQASTGRVQITTTVAHGLTEEDFVRIEPDQILFLGSPIAPLIRGEWAVAQVVNSTTFTINYPFPDGLFGNTISGYIQKWNPTGKGYLYPMISWGEEAYVDGGQRWGINSFSLAFYVKEILDKIFEKTGSKYESNFLNSNFFKRLILTQRRPNYEIPEREVKGRQFKVSNVVEWNLPVSGFGSGDAGYLTGVGSFPSGSSTLTPYSFTASIPLSDGFLYNGFEGDKPFDESISRWVVTDNGRYSLTFNITIDLLAEMSDFAKPIGGSFVSDPPVDSPSTRWYWGGWPTGLFDEGVFVIAKIKLLSGGIETTINQNIWSFKDNGTNLIIKDTFKDWRFDSRNISLSFTDRYLAAGDRVWIEISLANDFNNTQNGLFTEVRNSNLPNQAIYARRGKLTLRSRGSQILQNVASKTIIESAEVFPNSFLPSELTCRDFLLSIIRMFNLYIESDDNVEKLYRIEPRDDYYKDGSGGLGDYVDWTDKVHLERMEITPMGELGAKFYSFEYKSESDFWNKKYFDDTTKVYGNWIKRVNNDFLINEQKISISFAPTPMINNPEGSSIVIPQVVQRDNNGVNKPTNSGPKILFWGGRRPTSTKSPFRWTFVENRQASISGTQTATLDYTYYPYAGTVDSPLDPEIDLNWFYTDYVYWNRARWTNNNLYNKYWRRFIEEITDPDSKIIKADVKLSAKDINSLDFKKIYLINGHYFRLQKVIDYNANGDELTKCEFLKLKSTSKFKKESIPVADDFLDAIDNTHAISVSVIERAPRDFVSRTSLNNFTDSTLSGNQNVRFTGENNVVSERASNITLLGNENFIGSDSKNVSITGNGVFVSGGLQNINVIGTDRVFIDESDVTYINGIRYKKGVAISKANVIDGGLNIAIDLSAPNTTQNVVDGGEDLVIGRGSWTYENVINAGQDRILPDIPNYGVSTWTSPNPTTNLIGAVWKEPSARNNIDEIILRSDPVPFKNI